MNSAAIAAIIELILSLQGGEMTAADRSSLDLCAERLNRLAEKERFDLFQAAALTGLLARNDVDDVVNRSWEIAGMMMR